MIESSFCISIRAQEHETDYTAWQRDGDEQSKIKSQEVSTKNSPVFSSTRSISPH